ncbi:uncharacterized protein LOC143842646 [Paroedura picta]|uniref:uncharacterized protein LOC143842646 n=1 Tax=Paroedura picta TaxID=143630 RepID=UPI001015BCE7
MARRSSNGVSSCTLPSIPEYPGFQDIKDPGRTRPEHLPDTSSVVPNRSPGCFEDDFTEGYKTHNHFCDKSLQDYFNERLSELRNYEPKTSNAKMKSPPNENQTPSYSSGRARHQSNCSEVVNADHIKLPDESCDPANQASESMAACSDQGNVQNVEDCCYLEHLTMNIKAPLETFLQEK